VREISKIEMKKKGRERRGEKSPTRGGEALS